VKMGATANGLSIAGPIRPGLPRCKGTNYVLTHASLRMSAPAPAAGWVEPCLPHPGEQAALVPVCRG
jgi:hypothetical protein